MDVIITHEWFLKKLTLHYADDFPKALTYDFTIACYI